MFASAPGDFHEPLAAVSPASGDFFVASRGFAGLSLRLIDLLLQLEDRKLLLLLLLAFLLLLHDLVKACALASF